MRLGMWSLELLSEFHHSITSLVKTLLCACGIRWCLRTSPGCSHYRVDTILKSMKFLSAVYCLCIHGKQIAHAHTHRVFSIVFLEKTLNQVLRAF